MNDNADPAHNQSPTPKICFVIAPIGEPASEIRRRSDRIFRYVISPAVGPLGYFPERADQMPNPGMITSQVIQRLIDDSLVIADLTGANANVFYELAIRHAARKPFVQLIQEGEKPPFDLAGMRTIHVDYHDLESVDQAKTAIAAQLQSIEANPASIETPISATLNLLALSQSADPGQRSLSDIMTMIADLGSRFTSLESSLIHDATPIVRFSRLPVNDPGKSLERQAYLSAYAIANSILAGLKVKGLPIDDASAKAIVQEAILKHAKWNLDGRTLNNIMQDAFLNLTNL